MANVDQNETAAEKTRKVAEHEYIDANGAKVSIESGTGIKYKNLAENAETSYQLPGATPGSVQTMAALFGLRTLVINTASANKQAKDRGEEAGSAIDAIKARLGELVDGDWGAARGEGGIGRGYDLDKLADAIVQVFTAAGANANRDKIRKGLEEGMTRKDGTVTEAKKYRADMIKVEGVRAAYEALLGRAKSAAEVVDEYDVE